MTSTGLTFGQQEELLVLQMAHEKAKQQAEIDEQIAVEKLLQQTEQAKLNLLQYKLAFVVVK